MLLKGNDVELLSRTQCMIVCTNLCASMFKVVTVKFRAWNCSNLCKLLQIAQLTCTLDAKIKCE